jgi:selenocysteine-specific elongation factor
MARVTLLDRDVLAPGESGLVQLRLESPAVAVWGDRFVIRRYSPALTIGGGTILEPHPVKHRQSETGISAQLEALEGEDIVQAMAAKLLLARADAVDMRALAGDLGLNLPGVGAAADELVDAGLAIRVQVDRGEGLAHTERWNSLQTRAETGLAAFHADNPLKRGLNREELRARTGRGIPMGLFEQVLKEMERKGTITVDGSAVRLAAHQIRFSPEEEKLRDSIEGELKKADFAHMPDISQLAEHLGAGNKEIESVLRALERLGAVVFLEPTLVVHRDSVEVVREKLRHELRQKAEITVSEFRELIGSNRRYALALLNRFDGEGLTVRQGDLRTLR